MSEPKADPIIVESDEEAGLNVLEEVRRSAEIQTRRTGSEGRKTVRFEETSVPRRSPSLWVKDLSEMGDSARDQLPFSPYSDWSNMAPPPTFRYATAGRVPTSRRRGRSNQTPGNSCPSPRQVAATAALAVATGITIGAVRSEAAGHGFWCTPSSQDAAEQPVNARSTADTPVYGFDCAMNGGRGHCVCGLEEAASTCGTAPSEQIATFVSITADPTTQLSLAGRPKNRGRTAAVTDR